MDDILDLLSAVKDYMEATEQELGTAHEDHLTVEERITQGKMPIVYGDVLTAIGKLAAHEDPAVG